MVESRYNVDLKKVFYKSKSFTEQQFRALDYIFLFIVDNKLFKNICYLFLLRKKERDAHFLCNFFNMVETHLIVQR